MSKQKKAELIFDRWKADLKEMDRSKHQVQGNFELLFVTLEESKVEFDDAHVILDKAIKAHYPPQSAIDNTYRRLKPMLSGKTKQEFLDEWKENIAAAAKRAFYGLYSIDGAADQEEQKKFGSMSTTEYKKQRKYAESHPVLDWQSISFDIIDEELDFNNLEDDNE